MDLLETVAGKLVALAAGLAAAFWLARLVWRGFRKFDQILKILEWIEKEMKPNGGKSLRDSVDRLESSFSAHLNEHAKAPVQVNVGQLPPLPPSQGQG